MKLLMVGGSFDDDGGRKSSVVRKFYDAIEASSRFDECRLYNGGKYKTLENLLDLCKDYDVVIWWANVPNDKPKIRDVKVVAPHAMLVSSKRNDNNKYSFQELVNHALALKANLTVEFKKMKDGNFHFMIFDPLGCAWYEGEDISAAAVATADRLAFLISITRQKTYQSDESNGLILSWYFDRFKEEMYESGRSVQVPDEQKFVDQVKAYAEVFQTLMKPAKDVTRFLGNASMRPPVPPQIGRCGKGMPSFRKDGYIFVSQRNVDKQFLALEHFVPTYLEDDKVYYCGDKKPSVDTPIQLRLYQKLTNINYMIHSHCYIENAVFTSHNVPCGGLQEVPEILDTIERLYQSFDKDFYALNLIGHGSIVMASNVEDLAGLNYVGRKMPEYIG